MRRSGRSAAIIGSTAFPKSILIIWVNSTSPRRLLVDYLLLLVSLPRQLNEQPLIHSMRTTQAHHPCLNQNDLHSDFRHDLTLYVLQCRSIVFSVSFVYLMTNRSVFDHAYFVDVVLRRLDDTIELPFLRSCPERPGGLRYSACLQNHALESFQKKQKQNELKNQLKNEKNKRSELKTIIT